MFTACNRTFDETPPKTSQHSKQSIIDKLAYIDSLRKTGKTQQAIKELEDIKDISYEIDINSYVKVLYRLGDSYSRISSPADALPYFQTLYDSALAWNDTSLLIHSKANKGILFSNIKDTSKALLIFRELINDFAHKPNITQTLPQGFAPIYNSIAIILKDQNKLDSSLTYFQKALSNEDQLYNKAGIYNNIGTVYRMKNKLSLAHRYCDTAIQIAENHLHKENLSFFLCNKVRIYTKQRKYDQSLSYLNTIKTSFDSSFTWNVRKNYLQVKIDYFKAIGDFEKALLITDEYLEEDAQNHQDRKLQQFYNLLIKNENETKIKKINELVTQNEINRLSLKNQQTIIAFSIIAIILLGISLLQITKRHKRVNALNKSLVQKNLELLEKEHSSKVETKSDTYRHKEVNQNRLSTNIPDDLRKEIIEKLRDLSNDKELLCDSKLNIDMLAKSYNTNQKYLSQIINELRIKESCRLFTIQKYQNYTIEAIANEVGFTNKATFNRAFKKYTQLTPSVFRKHCSIDIQPNK
jgi:AraC-like DNA-binding protein